MLLNERRDAFALIRWQTITTQLQHVIEATRLQSRAGSLGGACSMTTPTTQTAIVVLSIPLVRHSMPSPT